MSFLKDKILIRLSILQLIESKDYESYLLVKKLNDLFGFDINNIYPIIYALVNEGYLETYDIENKGKKEKYYTLSIRGKDYYNELNEEFAKINKNFKKLKKEGKQND